MNTKIPQDTSASYEKSPNVRSLLRMDLTSQSFDWKEGRFVGDDRIPLWLQNLFHIVLCTAIIIIPALLYYFKVMSRPYNLFSSEPPPFYYWPLELVRWSLFLASGYLGFILTNVLIITATYATYHYYRIRQKEVTRKAQHRLDALLQLRYYIATLIGSIFLTMVAGPLFPLSKKEEMLQLFGQKAKTKAVGPGDDEEAVMAKLAFAEYVKDYLGHSLQFFVNRTAASLLVLTGFLLAEKILIQRIAFAFYQRSFSRRLEDNTFALKTSRRLKGLILQRHPELTGADLATIIHSGCCPAHRNVMTVADLVAYLPSNDAENLYQMMDVEATGEMALNQVQRAVARLLEEQENLRIAMLDQANIIVKLDNLIAWLMMIFILFITLTLFQVSWQTIVTALAGISGILLLICGGTIKTAFESIIFVIFTHPFDVGDRVTIGRGEFVVKELGLWTTVFEGAANALTYIANSKLRNEIIVNARRSPFQAETIRINVHPSTTSANIKQLENRLLVYLQQHAKDYIPPAPITGFNVLNKNTMTLEIALTHRGNFQDAELRSQRSSSFMLYLKEALKECGINLSPPEFGYSTSTAHN